MIADLLVGAIVSLPLAIAAWRVGRVSISGVVCGLLCGAIFYAAFYLAGLMVLGVGLALTVAASKLGARRLANNSSSDERRGVANIAANCGVGGIAAIAELMNVGFATEHTAVWAMSAVAAGVSDTVASEIGKAFGGTTRAFPTLRQVPSGTAGAVTTVGTIAGLCAAALTISPAPGLWLFGWHAFAAGVAGCFVGQLLESTLATLVERDTPAISHILNVINTLATALTAVSLL